MKGKDHMTPKTKYPEPGEIWMGNFNIISGYTPMVLAAAETESMHYILIISKTKGHARYAAHGGATNDYLRSFNLIALGLYEGKIVGIEDVDILGHYIKFVRVA